MSPRRKTIAEEDESWSARDDELVVIEDVPWEAYERIVEAFAECHLRHTYDRGRFEVPAVLYGVPWEAYEEFLAALPEHYVRHTYDRGTLELMTPSWDHEGTKKLLSRMLELMCFELGIPHVCGGSTTFRRTLTERGLQPDESYFVQHAKQAEKRRRAGRKNIPVPDLVLEVEISRSVVRRMPVYKALGVPEIWRVVKGKVEIHRRDRTGTYKKSARSGAFKFLRAEDINASLSQMDSVDENTLIRGFLARARERFGETTK